MLSCHSTSTVVAVIPFFLQQWYFLLYLCITDKTRAIIFIFFTNTHNSSGANWVVFTFLVVKISGITRTAMPLFHVYRNCFFSIVLLNCDWFAFVFAGQVFVESLIVKRFVELKLSASNKCCGNYLYYNRIFSQHVFIKISSAAVTN